MNGKVIGAVVPTDAAGKLRVAIVSTIKTSDGWGLEYEERKVVAFATVDYGEDGIHVEPVYVQHGCLVVGETQYDVSVTVLEPGECAEGELVDNGEGRIPLAAVHKVVPDLIRGVTS